MKKTIILTILAFFLCTFMTFAADLPRVVDSAGLLTESEETELTEKLDSISTSMRFDVVVLTMASINGDDPEDFSAWFWDKYGFGFNETSEGVMLLIVMDSRDCGIISFGSGQRIFTNRVNDRILDDVFDYLGSGDYYHAFSAFADDVNYCVSEWDNESGYAPGLGFTGKREYPLGTCIIISLIVGAIVGGIVVAVNRSKLKSVAPKNYAGDYIVDGSMNLTDARERFLYRHVSRTARQTSSGSRSGGGSIGRGGSSGHSSSFRKF